MIVCRKHYAGIARIAVIAIARATRMLEGFTTGSERTFAMSRAIPTARRIERAVATCRAERTAIECRVKRAIATYRAE